MEKVYTGQLKRDEWEALCDGYAKCWILKIIDKKKFISPTYHFQSLNFIAEDVAIIPIEKRM